MRHLCDIKRELAFSNISTVYCDTPTHEGIYVAAVPKSPDNNLYVRIPHPLTDAVLPHAMERLTVYYRNSFWRILNVFKCIQAAQALCKRGLNVDRLFLGISPGGVGQSLFSAHIAAVYASNHHFFDPNIWCNEDEMRKQVEALSGKIILTGQEAPDSNRNLKEDLFKRYMTGEGIPGRRPYGIVTRVMRMVGWKRLEVNRLLQFIGITESNYNSIMRRCLVYRISARFVEQNVLSATGFQDHDLNGVFVADPSLRTFVESGPAIAAAIRIQYGFECNHSVDQCRQLIESYVTGGGDGGLTDAKMRESCGLPPRCLGITKVAVLHQMAMDVDAVPAVANPPLALSTCVQPGSAGDRTDQLYDVEAVGHNQHSRCLDICPSNG